MPQNSRKRSTKTSGLQQQSLLRFIPSSPPLHQPSSHKIRGSNRRKARGQGISDEEEQGDQSSDVEAIHFEPRHAPNSSEVEDDAFQSPRRPKRLAADATRSATTVHVVSSEEAESDGEMLVPPRGKRKGKARVMVIEDSSSEEKQPGPKKRKFTKGERPLTPEPDSLADEVEPSRVLVFFISLPDVHGSRYYSLATTYEGQKVTVSEASRKSKA